MNIIRFVPVVMTLWTRVFEMSVVLGAVLSMFCFGVAANWLADRGPLFLIDSEHAYADPREVLPGHAVTIHRMLRRLQFCPINVAVWLVRDDQTFVHVDTYFAFSPPDRAMRDFKLVLPIPSFTPPGKYTLRTYVSCQRNPLVDVTQLFTDIPLEVLPTN